MEGSDIPTVHISLPEKLYSRLKRIASDMGIQITDLIKMFIKAGLDGGTIVTSNAPNIPSNATLSKVEKEVSYLKGRVYIMDLVIKDLQSKIEELERRLEEIESPDVLFNIRRYSEGRLNKP